MVGAERRDSPAQYRLKNAPRRIRILVSVQIAEFTPTRISLDPLDKGQDICRLTRGLDLQELVAGRMKAIALLGTNTLRFSDIFRNGR
jgi:hypothetical protein